MGRRSLAAAITCAVGVAAACSSFGSTPTAREADAGTADGSTPSPESGTSNEASTLAALYPSCPPTGPDHVVHGGAVAETIVRAPADVEYPFTITTDASSIYWVGVRHLDPADNAYNGDEGTAAIHRVSKDGTFVDNASTILVDHQPPFVALALDGDKLYWATTTELLTSFFSIPRDCTSCAPTPVASPLASGPIVGMRRLRANVIIVLDLSGRTWALRTDENVLEPLAENAVNPGLAITNDAVFLTTANASSVDRITVTDSGHAGGAFGTIAASGPLGAGGAPLATDCTSLFVARNKTATHELWISSAVGDAVSFARWNASAAPDVFSLVADARAVYSGSANGLGIFSYDQTVPGAPPSPIVESFSAWSLALDESGLYAGEHTQDAVGIAGAIWRFR